jgi:hypothetical protein
MLFLELPESRFDLLDVHVAPVVGGDFIRQGGGRRENGSGQ